MSSALGTLALAVLAGIAFAAASSILLSCAWPLLRHRLKRRHPAIRARITLAWAVAPGLVPLLLVGLCFTPGVLGLLGLHADHCVHHPGHPHLCLVHPTAMLTMPLAGLLALCGVLAAGAAARFALRTARTHRALARLRNGASRELTPGIRCVESSRPFSLTAALGRSEIFVSSALAEALSPDQLEVVIEHERAHARRRDGLRRALAYTCSWPLAPRVRREVLAELELATEQSCDEIAGRCLGDRVRVAEAILGAERLLAAAPSSSPGALLAFGGSSVPARVRALLAEPESEGAVPVWWTLGILALVSCLIVYPLHHATEHLLGLLLGLH